MSPSDHKEPAFHGDWTEDELAAVEELLEEYPPETLEDYESEYDIPDWLPAAILDAGMGAEPDEILGFFKRMVATGWTAANYRAFPAVVHHEFQRRKNLEDGKRWSKQDRATLRVRRVVRA